MRLKMIFLSSTSIATLAVAAMPANAQAPADPPETIVGDEIVVIGIRRSLESAQAIKFNSDQIVDAIVAEDIGKLPDLTASESLARVTGVQVTRGGGEAGGVRIRGLPDITTTHNGREIFTAEVRSVALQDFPAGGVAALEVYKSTTAELIEGGIGGLINVRSRRPFNFEGARIAGAVNGIYTDQADKVDWNGNILLSNRWETGIGEAGALINASYTELGFLDSARFNSGFIDTAQPAWTTTPGFRFPDAVGIFYGRGDRSRPSVNGALQWRPTDALEFSIDGLYQGFRNEVADRRLFVPLFGPTRQYTNVVLQSDANAAQSMTASNLRPPEMFQGATSAETDTYQFAVGGVYDAGGGWRISADLARTDSQFDLSVYSFDTAFASSPVVDVNFDVPEGDGGVEFSFQNFDVTDPANFIYRGFFDRHLVAAGDDIQFRSDVTFETGLSLIPELDFGIRFVDRDSSFENGQRFSRQGQGQALTVLPVDHEVIPAGFRGSIQPTRVWVSPTRDSIRNNVAQLRDIAGFASGRPPADPLSAYTTDEKAYTVYGQLRYEFDAAFPITGILGLRAVKTETTLNGTSRVAAGGGVVNLLPVTKTGEYTDYLPNVSAILRFTEDFQLRLSATQTRTRPDFSQLNPSLRLNPPSGACADDPTSEDCFRTGSGGNPDLDPIESNNYDASLEYRLSQSGLASIALFRRDIDGFISNFTTTVVDPEFGQLQINRPENGGEGELEGFEAQITTFLDYDFLPAWMHNFGGRANFTYIDSAQAFPAALGEDLPDQVRIPGVSKNTYNLVAFFEQQMFSARLAYNYRSDWVNFFSQTAEGGQFAGEFTEDVSRLDFSASYTPIENLTIAFDVSNISGEPFQNFRNYTEDRSFPRDVRYEERVYSLGVRFRY